MQCIAVNVLRKNTNHIWKKFLLKYVSEATDVMSHALKAVAHFFLTERFFLSPFNKVFSAAMLCRLLRFAHGFVFAPQNFFIGWGRFTACIAGHAIQRRNPQDESQRFSKWRLPTIPQRSAGLHALCR